MNTDLIKGNWKQIKGKVKQQWGKLTSDEIDGMEGSFDELCGMLQEKYGYGKDKAKKEISSWLDSEDIEDVKDRARNAIDSLSERFSHASETIYQTANDLKDKTCDMQKHAVDYIKENPAKSLGIALLVGIFVRGLLKK